MTLETLIDKGQPNTAVARLLGVTEGTIRYHRNKPEGAADKRKDKHMRVEPLADAIRYWVEAIYDEASRGPINAADLFDYLVEEHHYDGSYRSVLRYVKRQFPLPAGRPYRRVETPPGAQSQTDWLELSGVDIGAGPQDLNVLVISLSHSRMAAAIWSDKMDQLAWHHCHNEAFKRLGGIPAVNRIDNLKTGVASGAGATALLNESYRAYAKALRFHIDPCQARSPEQKGKVERRIGALTRRIHPGKRVLQGIDALQSWTDYRLERWAQHSTCPATGKTVWATWKDEQAHLGALPLLPQPFDISVTRTVGLDCTVRFEGRTYSVPHHHWKQQVEVRGCHRVVQIVAGGRIVAEHPRGTRERILVRTEHYEGRSDRHAIPLPLGQMGRRLQEIYEMPVEARPLDLYAALVEVAR